MKKILLVFGSLERAGAQLRTIEVCRVLREQDKVQFDFCCIGRKPVELQKEIKDIGGNIYLIPARSPDFLFKFSNLLKSERYDALNSFPKLWSGLVLWLADRHQVPLRIASFRTSVVASSGLQLNPVYIWLMRTLIKHHATRIVAVSRAALDSMFPFSWQSSCDCRVIYNGLALPPFQAPVERRAVREEFGWPLESQIVINVARFSLPKNHQTILEATHLAYQQDQNLRLLLVGSGQLQQKISQLVHDYGLSDICCLAGLRKDVPRLLLASDIFFFPSLWEGLPGALLEAIAAGLPAVTSNIPPIQEIAPYFPSSICMALPNDVSQHVEHLLTMLGQRLDPSVAKARFSKTPFTLENAVKAYSALYGVGTTDETYENKKSYF